MHRPCELCLSCDDNSAIYSVSISETTTAMLWPDFISVVLFSLYLCFFFSSRRRHTRFKCDWSSDVCSSDLCWTSNLRLGHRRQSEVRCPATLGYEKGLRAELLFDAGVQRRLLLQRGSRRSEERRVGKEGRSRWSPYH